MPIATSNYGWFSQTDMENLVGAENIRQWSNPSGFDKQTPTNTTIVQNAINYADQLIYYTFRNYGNYTFPLAPYNAAVYTVRDWGVKLAVWQLYIARGLRDDKGENKYNSFRQEAVTEMARRISEDSLDASRRYPQSNVPFAVL